MENCKENKKDILTRLRRIEGQVKGVQKMVENEQKCGDILIQIAAIRSAINKVGGLMLENYSKECVALAIDEEKKGKEMNELIEIILKFIK